ncbi:MAG TPA: flagellar hook-associated protein FlgL [Solimonas sp.]|nr:flagellar hook-associated protein FlgL [Solimonas sp.]
MTMRISTAWRYEQGVTQMMRQQQKIAATQNQLSTNRKWQTAADDPAGWSQAQNYDRLVAQTAQYTSAAQTAQQRLQLGEDTIASGIGLLQHVRELVVEANTATQSADTRKTIAAELGSVREQLMALANTGDGQGRYLFGGADDGSAPFAWNGGSADYRGDQTTVSAQIGSERTVAQNDPGSRVFMNLKTGNGTFAVSAASSNTGSAAIGSATLVDADAWDGGSYTLRFTAADQYEIVDASNNVLQSGSAGDGATITFRGASLTLSGTAAAGDSFAIAPSASQDMFAMIDQLAKLLTQPQDSAAQRAQVQTALQQGLGTLQSAEDRLGDVRSGIGIRLNAIDDALDVAAAQSEHATAAASTLRDTDYADAVGKLQLQMTTLQAAQQVYTKVQGLSLFDYLR